MKRMSLPAVFAAVMFTVGAASASGAAPTQPPSGMPSVSQLDARIVDDPIIIAAYAERAGINLTEARRRLHVEALNSMVVDTVKRILGDRFAGVWYDSAKTRYRVGDLDGTATSKIGSALTTNGTQGYVDVVSVKLSVEALEAAQQRLMADRSITRKSGNFAVSIDLANNGLHLYVRSGEVQTRNDAEAAARSAGLPYKIDTMPTALADAVPAACTWPHCNLPLRGGLRIAPTGYSLGTPYCTLGFMAVLPTDYSIKYAITAGHCIYYPPYNNSNQGAIWRAYHPADGRYWNIGPSFSNSWFTDSRGDAAKIRVQDWNPVSPWYTTTLVGRTATWQNDDYLKVTGWSPYPSLNQLYCRYGGTTQRSCGYVKSNGPTCMDFGSDGVQCNLWWGDACAQGGDSGGPATGYGNVALGIVDRAGGGNCPPPSVTATNPITPPNTYTTIFTDIQSVQDNLNAWIIWE